MNRRRRILAVVLIVLAIFVVFCAIAWQYSNRITAIKLRREKESFEAQITRALPPGSDKVRVQHFLDSIRMSYVETGPIADKTAPDDSIASVIEATSRDTLDLPLGSCSTSAKFKFDAHGALLGYTDWHSCKWVW
jgi:hypothetical protein